MDIKQRNYWYIQMSSGIAEGLKIDLAILKKNKIAIIYDEKSKPKNKIEDFKKMKKGDIVLVKRDNSTIALVEIIDNDTKLYGKKINNRTINYYQHNIRILEENRNRPNLPECRGILQKTSENSPIYKYIYEWYSEIINRDSSNNIKPKGDIPKLQNITTIDIEIKNLKSIKELKKKFRIKLNGELYIIVGNNGLGKSTLLISIGHLTKQIFLQREFKGDSFNSSRIIYTFNNTEKFEWKKFNQKSGARAWTIQNRTASMPRIDGIFESGIVSGARFEHLEFKKDVLEQVDKNKIKGSSKQDKDTIKVIRDI